MGTRLVERVDGITDLVRSRVDDIEAGRRITDDVLEAIRGTGLNRAFVPTALGGDEVEPTEVIDALARLAAVDGSVGWNAAVGMGSNLFSGYLPHVAAKEVFADPDACNAGIFAPMGHARPGADGHVLSGRWPFASNSLHSTWLAAGTWYWGADEQMEPAPRMTMVRAADVEIEDTWHSEGLCGTGSHHVQVADLPVDRAWSYAFGEPAVAEGTLWRIPMFSILGAALGVVPLGIAQGAVDEVARMVRDGVAGMRGSISDDTLRLADFAMASARLRGARTALADRLSRMWELADAGAPISRQLQAELALAINHGCEVAVDVTSTAHRIGGGAAAYCGHGLLRALLDVHTGRQHIMFGIGHRPVLAKVAAGVDVAAPPFVT